MTILDYSGILRSGGGMNVGQTAIDTAQALQGFRARELGIQQAQEQRQAQQRAQAQQQQARSVGAELLTTGTPDEIAAFGIKNPAVMRDFIAAAQFQDQQAVMSRLNYAKDILSGRVDPRTATEERIRSVEAAGGDATGLRRTLEGTDEDIRAAAEKDLAVIDPKSYQSYRKVTGQQVDKEFAPQISPVQTDPETGQKYIIKTDRNTGESVRSDVESAIGESVSQTEQRLIRKELLKDAIAESKTAFDNLKGIRKNISTIDEAIRAIDAGAQSGFIEKYLPSLRESTINLENAAARMGLDIIQATTFGALSEGELKLAMDTAVPKNLKPKELRTWLVNRKKAQNKLSNELKKMAITLGKGKTTIAEYLENNATINKTPLSDAELLQKYGG